MTYYGIPPGLVWNDHIGWHLDRYKLFMPDDLVVARFKDADEAGDYRVLRHGDVVGNPDYEITDMDAQEFLSD